MASTTQETNAIAELLNKMNNDVGGNSWNAWFDNLNDLDVSGIWRRRGWSSEEKLLCNEYMVDTLHNDEPLYLSKEQRDSQTVRKVNPQSRLLKCIYTDEGLM
jgi:hypothetical protein